MNKFILALLFSLCCLATYAQRIHGSIGYHIPRDKVLLLNKDVETGKVIYSDSSKITLQKLDYSEKNIERKDIDTITGLSYFTYFCAPSLGYEHWKGLINQRLDTFSTDAFALNCKVGYMRKKRFAANIDLGFRGGNNHNIFRGGIGIRRYLFSNYTWRKAFYLGLNFGYNFPNTNMNRFFDLGWVFGYEFLVQDKNRFFIEYNTGRAQKYDPRPAYNSLTAGIRFSIEYKNYYRRINLK